MQPVQKRSTRLQAIAHSVSETAKGKAGNRATISSNTTFAMEEANWSGVQDKAIDAESFAYSLRPTPGT